MIIKYDDIEVRVHTQVVRVQYANELRYVRGHVCEIYLFLMNWDIY